MNMSINASMTRVILSGLFHSQIHC